jgi:hypothetical protein
LSYHRVLTVIEHARTSTCYGGLPRRPIIALNLSLAVNVSGLKMAPAPLLKLPDVKAEGGGFL